MLYISYTLIHTCIHTYVYIYIYAYIYIYIYIAHAFFRGIILHARTHKHEDPLDNATAIPIEHSSENPQDKWQSFETYHWNMKVRWEMPLNIHWNMPLRIHDYFWGVDFRCAIFAPRLSSDATCIRARPCIGCAVLRSTPPSESRLAQSLWTRGVWRRMTYIGSSRMWCLRMWFLIIIVIVTICCGQSYEKLW